MRAAFTALTLLALIFAVPARADQRTSPVNLRAGSLAAALQDLTRQTGLELLYDRSKVRGVRSRAVRGRLSGQAALQQLLSGTDLTMRRSPSGAWLIERRRPVDRPAAPPELDVPEILITGRRTQNSDIRRRENDVQPYQVTTGEQIARAHRDDVDQYFRSRVTANTQALPPSLMTNGETVSEIDLRGLGPEGTLVLLDGRRMPSIPVVPLGLRQGDLNAVPLHAIERIETLTGTAGGIHGFGALGGVVNVILKRDYRGAELHITGGISTRGDAGRLSLEGRLGFTPDNGRTDIMVYFSRTRSQPLLAGQRDYLRRDRERSNAFARGDLVPFFILGNGVSLFNLTPGENLVLKPQFGGTSLGSDHSFLPTGFTGNPAQLLALLAANAGQLDTRPSEDEGDSYIGSTARTEAVILNVRRRFGGNFEAYLDAVFLRNDGRSVDHGEHGLSLMPSASPDNPFEQSIWITFPTPRRTLIRRARFDTERYTAGVVTPLPFGWRGTAEATFGAMRTRHSTIHDPAYSVPLFGDLNPLGDWEVLQREIIATRASSIQASQARNRFQEQSLRLAGPLFELAAGPVSLTLLAERRRESFPIATGFFAAETPGFSFREEFLSPPRRSTTRSVYAELRSRLYGEDAPVALLRHLEIQLAIRHDDQRVSFSRSFDTLEPDQRTRAAFAGTAYSAGARITPVPWLTLRASYATGEQPPPLQSLIDTQSLNSFLLDPDPRRGNEFAAMDSIFLHKTVGSPELTTARASTLSLGAILMPLGEGGPRLSLDYSRIRRTGDVYFLTDQMVLENELSFPERVSRDPLTDEDRASGYTGGRITMLDARAMNGAGRSVDTIDGRFDWPLSFLGGRLKLYGLATWQMRNVQHRLLEPQYERVGYLGSPLGWRANGGLDWTAGALSVGANLQYFSRYRFARSDQPGFINDFGTKIQGARRVRAQAFLDLYVSRRFRLPPAGSDRELSVDLGIVNLLDNAPPREAAAVAGAQSYSLYGDPRRRRVELVLSFSY
jgi:outer membrane receptor protein involved in Fe transport